MRIHRAKDFLRGKADNITAFPFDVPKLENKERRNWRVREGRGPGGEATVLIMAKSGGSPRNKKDLAVLILGGNAGASGNSVVNLYRGV